MNSLTHFKKIPILPLLIALALVAWTAGTAQAVISDFNGDGHPDFVLHKACPRQTAIWYLNNNVFISGASGPTLVAGWYILAGVADFNRDGHPDYLLLDSGISPDTEIWYLSGRTLVGSARGPSVPRVPSGWGWWVSATLNGDAPRLCALQCEHSPDSDLYFHNNVYVVRGHGRTLPVGWFVVGVADLMATAIQIICLRTARARPRSGILSGRTPVGGVYGPTIASGWDLELQPTLTATDPRLCALNSPHVRPRSGILATTFSSAARTAQLFLLAGVSRIFVIRGTMAVACKRCSSVAGNSEAKSA